MARLNAGRPIPRLTLRCVGANGRTAVISQSAPRGVLCVSGASRRNAQRSRALPPLATRHRVARRPRPASARSTSSLLPARQTLLGRRRRRRRCTAARPHDGLLRWELDRGARRLASWRGVSCRATTAATHRSGRPQRAPLQAWGAPRDGSARRCGAVSVGGGGAGASRRRRPPSAIGITTRRGRRGQPAAGECAARAFPIRRRARGPALVVGAAGCTARARHERRDAGRDAARGRRRPGRRRAPPRLGHVEGERARRARRPRQAAPIRRGSKVGGGRRGRCS